MARSNALAPYVFVLLACSSDRDVEVVQDASAGGSGGQGGAGGAVSGGTGGAAAAGSGGTGGVAGTGGATGGSSGTGGAAGGATGGTGGATGGTGGVAGAGGTGTIGQSCSPNGALACAGHAQKALLVCNVTWQPNGVCSGSNNCDTSGANLGSCQPIVSECVGKVAGDAVCSGGNAVECGIDLVTTDPVQTCTNQACVSGACTGVCSPGAKQCSGNGVQTCNAAGQWGAAVACAWPTPACASATGTCVAPPSCEGLATNCGPSSNDSCCTSPSVTGGTHNRSNDPSYPATVSTFRLDKYEVTVGRFRKFVDAVVAGWRPDAGSGKHTHLHGGSGLSNSSGTPSYEPGWDTAWDTHLHATKATWDGSTSLACQTSHTWTASPGSNETRPINCTSWYQAHAFCIWDGGFLPSEAEWNFAAAGGGAQRDYPWGPAAPGADASFAAYSCYYNGAGTCTGVTNIAPVGSVPAGNGLYGQSDLAGNVWEWNLDWYVNPYATQCTNCAHLPASSFSRVIRGGSFASDASTLFSSYRNNYTPLTRNQVIGVRCARVP